MTPEEVTTLLGSTGGRLFLAPQADQPARVYTCGEALPAFQPETVVPLEQHFVWREFFKPQTEVAPPPPVWALTDLHREAPMLLRAIAFRNTPIRGLLVMPLQYRQQFYGYLTLFRNEIETEILWAGRFNPDQRQTEPRRSFEVWQQLQQGQAQPWTEAELQVARAVAHHCSLSIHHHQLHEQVHRLNANLEQQVQERTTQLEQALSQAIVQAQQLAQLTERQQVLAKVISTIRASLDLDTLFNATSREVRQLLNADRVGVFRFYPESHFDDGEFVSEDVLPDFPSALAAKIHDHCFGDRYAVAYQQGRIQVVDNVNTAELSPCHLEVLSRFEIKANLVVPLLQGEELWGLLCIHQCAQPRHWQADEIEFIQQIASQLGVALQQAELFSQTRHQADQLAQALHNLQQTQTNLIQTEKMSSLGQLVAGVAHEINNPVNFIYGNLSHASEYTHDLLELLQLYQEQYPNPANVVADKAQDIDLEFLTEDLPKMLSSMKVGADRIRQIVLSLRNFSRLDQAEMKPVDIHEGIDSTLMILQHRLKARTDSPPIQVVKHYGNLPPVECYAGQLNQVFMNVIGNAIDALDSAIKQSSLSYGTTPTIAIQTELQEGDRVVIRISDNGPGISEAVRTRIFDPFFTTKAVGHGTGLGLSISYQIVVDKHGGTLQCLSEPDQGTEFWIEIPRAQSSSKTPQPESVQAR